MTDEQIAHNIGINTATLYNWKKDNRPIFITKDKHGKPINKIDEALKKGKEIVDYAVQNALLKKALGGDTVAMIFWLKNRKPSQWRDRPVAVESMDTEDMKPLASLLGEPHE